ncbi:MAG: hypothetical protein IT529_22215 [Burkholderiales bacterium]|nr:hypothetical protein [Burkholderiales bacterium]
MLPSLPFTGIPAADEALRAPVREFLRTTLVNVPPEVRARSWMGFDARFSRQIAERHWLGLSQFVVDLGSPGITITPIRDLAGDTHFSEIVFDDVRVPDDALIGAEGGGWEQVNAELAFERSGPERILSSIVLVDEWLEWLRGRADGGIAPPTESMAALGRIASRLALLRQMSIAVTGKLADGVSPVTEAALVKDLGTALEQEIPDVIARLLGAEPDIEPPARLLRTLNFVARMAPSYSLRGGTREVLRGIIARALGLR